MDEEDRFSASSGESERDNEPDEVMEDVDEGDNDAEPDEDNNEDDEEDEGDNDNDNEPEAEAEAEAEGEAEAEAEAEAEGEAEAETETQAGRETDNGDEKGKAISQSESRQKSSTPAPTAPLRLRPTVRPEALHARLYDIVPTMAAPQSTSVNAMAITPDMRYWFTGGSDGYIRKYDGPGTINGKLTLTVAQKHPFVDSVTKAGILMSYWENEEPLPPGRGDQEHILSPVYSLAVHSDALWLLSGLESGGINLQSVRHDEGKKIYCLRGHTNAVSVLTLAQDEKSVLSGAWDKNIFDWDLNTGQKKRSFDGSGGQISAIELRPASGDPIPAGADELPPSTTISTNNGAPPVGAGLTNGFQASDLGTMDKPASLGGDDRASPAHESLFGGSDAGSLFGETAGDAPFGHDDDEYNAAIDIMPGHEGGMDHSADMAMTTLEMNKDVEKEPAPAVQPPPSGGDAMDIDAPSQQDFPGATTTQGSLDASVGASVLPDTSQQTQQAQENRSQNDQDRDDAQNNRELDQQLQQSAVAADSASGAQGQSSPILLSSQPPKPQYDPTQTSSTTFLSATIDGPIRLWDRRVQNPVARISNRVGVPPWCMSACWSPDGNKIYAGRRNGTVEEFDVRKAQRGWTPERVLKFPAGSGAVSAVKPMVNGRHLVCASHDIIRLYDLQDTRAFKHSTVPFLIIPGPPRAGVISSLYIDPTSRFMLSAAGTRGWEGTSTEVLIGYEINVLGD
ncbi:WD40-repeat-containing domain protein [Stachybotrys elegans]|uniref:WD40-repeat-containing domain protein n=1 Tax=Stachybotrys elegans TaxID=80388 RepID=A0A8K0SL84_9HYPO|nr:WD40-repeat-containing domain protein [Stachybotrys elegans]